MREQPLLQPGDEYRVELESLRRVHGHQLQRILAGLRLVVARFERRVRQESRQRRRNLRGGFGLRARRVLGVTLLRHEGSGRVDQLVQVLDALLAFPLVLVMRNEPAALDHRVDDLGQRQRSGFEPQAFDQLHECRQACPAPALQRTDRRVQALARRPRGIRQLLERARANATRGKVDHTQERGVVGRVLDQPQVGQRVLDLGSLEKAEPAVYAIRNGRVEQRVLDDARLRVRAV